MAHPAAGVAIKIEVVSRFEQRNRLIHFLETIDMNKRTRHIKQNVATIIKSLMIHSIANFKELWNSIISFFFSVTTCFGL